MRSVRGRGVIPPFYTLRSLKIRCRQQAFMEILGQPPALVGSKSYPAHLHPQRSIGALEEPARVHHGNAPLKQAGQSTWG